MDHWDGGIFRAGQIKKLLENYRDIDDFDVMTAKDVEALTGYAVSSVNNWIRRGYLKAFRKKSQKTKLIILQS